jgi:hypothetical protein
MSILRFRPEIWSAVLLDALEKALVYAAPGVVNRDYEGEISQMGDTVHISSVGDPTISDYTAGGTLTYEDLTDAGQVLLIDQGKSFSFKVDDVDRRQARGDVMSKAMQRAAYKLRDKADQLVASMYTSIVSANTINTTSITTADGAYNALVDLGVIMDEANISTEGRVAIIPPWYHGLLQKNANFINAEKSADGGRALRNGVIGEAAGFSLRKSNNVPVITGDDYAVMGLVDTAISYADQIVQTEALRLQTTFADAVRGLHVYGAKMVQPAHAALLKASKT